MVKRRVVVLGAGVAGLETALGLRALAEELVSVEVVAPEQDFSYRPLAVAEPFQAGEVRRFPLESLVRAAGATLRAGRVAALDPGQKVVTLAGGVTLPYDTAVLALGARPREAVPGALTFRGQEDLPAFEALLARATAGDLRRIAFVAPRGATWPLPLYELALLTAGYLVEHMTRGVELVIATPEERPLELFGDVASTAIAQLLELRGITFEHGTAEADAVVALPLLEGVPIDGVPQDSDGFVSTDEYGWVLGLNDVYAAGDLTQFPIKQGGLAAQQAEAVASSIAADAGALVRPVTFKPVLRGLLLTGMTPRFLRAGPGGHPSLVDTQPLWWPPAKIVGRYLTPFLADHLGLAKEATRPPQVKALQVDVALDTGDHAVWSSV